jgi:zinc transport system substrate-binding protein
MKIQVKTIAQALIPFVNKELLEERARILAQELDVLGGQIKELLSKYRGIILVSHPVYAYLIDGLPIEQVSLEQEGKELSPKAFSNVIEQAKKQHVTTVFTQPQYSKKSAEKVAAYIQAKIVSLNPYGREYCKELLKIARAFHDELEQQKKGMTS